MLQIEVRRQVLEQLLGKKPSSNKSLARRVEGIEPVVKTLNASAYTASSSSARTASGATATAWYTVAAGSGLPIGTVIYIPYFASQPNRRMVCSTR